MLCLPKLAVCAPIRCLHCNNLRDLGHTYKLPDLRPPNSPDLNPIDYEICGVIQQRVQSTKVQGVKDLTQHLIDVWAGVKESAIQDAIYRQRRHLHT